MSKKQLTKKKTTPATKRAKEALKRDGVFRGVVDWMKKHKMITVVVGVLILAVLVVGMCILMLCMNRGTEVQNNAESGDASIGQEVDFSQRVTAEDGGEFQAVYRLGASGDFAVRFADLVCDDDCKNIENVRLGEKTLRRGEDYEVRSGSVIIVLLGEMLEKLTPGGYELTFEVTDRGEVWKIGVKFAIEEGEPTCGEGEKLENGECVVQEKVTQEAENSTVTKPGTSNGQKPAATSNQSTSSISPTPPTSSKSPEQVACEAKVGPTGFLRVYWLSPAEKQAWMDDMGAGADIVATVMMSNFQGTTSMVWRDGHCQPSIKSATAAGGPVRPYNQNQLPAKAQANVGRNAIIWIWVDGSEQIELVNDPDTFIYNHF